MLLIFYKARRVLFVILAALIPAAVCACASGDTHDREYKAYTEDMTRQEFYAFVYEKIMNDDILRGAFIPDIQALSAEKAFYGAGSYEPDSYEGGLYEIRKKHISELSVNRLTYKSTGACEAHWTWRGEADWSRLISDFNDVAACNRAAAAFMCESGLADIEIDMAEYSLKLHPNEHIPRDEADAVLDAVRTHKRSLPVNALKTCDAGGNEIYIHFSDPVQLIVLKSITGFIEENGGIDNSFIYFGKTGVNISLWINTYIGGMLELPLDISGGGIFEIPCHSKVMPLNERAQIAASLLSDSDRVDFMKYINEAMLSDSKDTLFTPADELVYKLGNTNHTVKISIDDSIRICID